MLKKSSIYIIFAIILLTASQALAQHHATLYLATDHGEGKRIGRVIFTDTDKGVNLSYVLKDLPPGQHGFHVHENPDCSPQKKDGNNIHASAAGGHYDPKHTGKHLGPYGDGHRGDLPFITVKEDGTAMGNITFGQEKGLKAAEFNNRAIIIHAGGDNYSDQPLPLGGGGARIACGIITD